MTFPLRTGVAQLNGAPCEAEQHAPIALKDGLSATPLAALNDWREATVFDAAQRAALTLCDAMTRQILVDAATLGEVKRQLGDRQTVEQVATIASYNMVSCFLEALQILSTDAR